MVLGEQAVDVHAAAADETALGPDEAVIWKATAWWRVGGAAQDVEGAGLDAAGDLGEPLVPVGVELDAALLHDDAGVVLPGVEGDRLVSKVTAVSYRSCQVW